MTYGEATARGTRTTAWIVAAMAVVALLPFLVAATPSMTDWPGHVGRYHVMLEHGRGTPLDRYYAFDWHLVGNLGVDLVVAVLGPLLGVERAAWAVSALLAPLAIVGIVAAARAAHGRVGPGAALACLLVFGNSLMFGFLNYCLALALALLVFALWLRLRERPLLLHLALLTPLASGVWLAHAVGWGVLVLLAAGFEGERLWRRRAAFGTAATDGALRELALLPPVALTLLWRSGSGQNGPAFAYGTELLQRKVMNWVVVLRGGSAVLDLGTLLVIGAVVLALARAGRWRIDWRIGAGAVLLALACVVLPVTIFGSWGADERLAPAALIAGALALRWQGSAAGGRRLAMLALALFAVRIGAVARDWHRLDAQYREDLAGLDRVPRGARIQALVLTNACHAGWRKTAYPHLPDLAIVRRDAFVNAEWPLGGSPLLRVTYAVPDALRYDPSQMVDAFDCAGRPTTAAVRARLALIGTVDHDYVWMLDTHGRRDLWPGHVPLYRTATSELYALR